MKKILFPAFFLLIGLGACKNNAAQPEGDAQESAAPKGLTWDSIYYQKYLFSNNFISALGKLGKPVEMMPNQIVVDGQPINFPGVPKRNRLYHFKGSKDNTTYSLDAVRVNYSTVKFLLEITRDGKSAERYEGEADINPAFYLGAESDTDDQSGMSYPSYEFSYLKNACTTYLRIGEDGGTVKARISRDCYEDAQDIVLENSPTLRE